MNPNYSVHADHPAPADVAQPLIYECDSLQDFHTILSQVVQYHSTALVPEYIQADFYLRSDITIHISPTAITNNSSNSQDDNSTLSPTNKPSNATEGHPTITPQNSVISTISPQQQEQQRPSVISQQQNTITKVTSVTVADTLANQPLTQPHIQKAVARTIFAIVGSVDGFGWTTRNVFRSKDGWRVQHTCTDGKWNGHRAANAKKKRVSKGARVSGVGAGAGDGDGDGAGKLDDDEEDGAIHGDGEQVRKDAATGGGGLVAVNGATENGPSNGNGIGNVEKAAGAEVGEEGEDGDESAKRGPGFLPTYDCNGLTTCVFSISRQALLVKYTHCPVHRTVAQRKALEKGRTVVEIGEHVARSVGRPKKYKVGVNGYPPPVVAGGGGGYGGQQGQGQGQSQSQGQRQLGDGEADAEGEEVSDVTDPGIQLLREWNQSQTGPGAHHVGPPPENNSARHGGVG